MKRQVTVSIDRELVATIDKKRGDVNRSRYLERLIESQLSHGENP